MNTITKIILSFVLPIACITTLRAQLPCERQKQEKQGDVPDMPFYNKQKIEQALNRQTEYDTVWLPVKVTQQNYLIEITYFEEYKYNELGVLQKWIRNHSPYVAEYIFNQTYLVDGKDIIDTITIYMDDGFENLMPYQRTVYENYHNEFWYADYNQKWENNQWVTIKRHETYLMDTLNVAGFRYLERNFSDGVLIQEEHQTLEFDERKNVTKVSCQAYRLEEGENLLESEYFYNENNILYEEHFYLNYGEEQEKMLRDKIYWEEWEEFHGFLNGDIIWFEYAGPPNFNRPNKPNKRSIYRSNDGLNFDFLCTENYLWNIDGNNSTERYDYLKWGDSIYLALLSGIYWDEYGNQMGDINRAMYRPYKYGNYHDTSYMIKHQYINYYDERNRFYKYDFYQIFFDDQINYGSGDNILIYTAAIDSFTYVIRPVGIDELPLEIQTLLIVPNPADETVRITATDSIATVTFYTTDGRLVYTQNGSEKEMIVNLHGLSKGIYLVQARLKDGGVQTGKVVVR